MIIRDLIRPIRYQVDRLLYEQSGRREDVLPWRNRYPDSTVLIIGNGPSLNNTPLDEFIGIPAIGMNKIDLLFDRTRWRPTMILCNNPLVAKQNQEYYANTDIPVFISWKSRWFMGRTARSRVKYFLEKPDQSFSEDASVAVSAGGTVTFSALQFAHYMGARNVILFGVDHSFKAQGKANRVVVNNGTDPDHFDPNYFAHGNAWMLPDLDASARAYVRARQAFERSGRKIYDATVGGHLTVFPKISIDEARSLAAPGGR